MQKCKQDMPPPCGYAPIEYKKIPLKSGWDPRLKLLVLVASTAAGYAMLRNAKWQLTKNRLEDWSTDSALMPMVVAETDRMLLKQLKKNREIEEKIMKDVEGWEVGKWMHLPVFSSFGPDEFYRPNLREYFMHEEEKELKRYYHLFVYN